MKKREGIGDHNRECGDFANASLQGEGQYLLPRAFRRCVGHSCSADSVPLAVHGFRELSPKPLGEYGVGGGRRFVVRAVPRRTQFDEALSERGLGRGRLPGLERAHGLAPERRAAPRVLGAVQEEHFTPHSGQRVVKVAVGPWDRPRD